MRVLAAVDDSPPAIAAARTAISIAADQDASLHLVSVRESADHRDDVLDHLGAEATSAGVDVTTSAVDNGPPFEVLLRVAREWEADLIVMGRSDNRRPGVPYVGSQTEHLLEFTHVPVLVVPYLTAGGP